MTDISGVGGAGGMHHTPRTDHVKGQPVKSFDQDALNTVKHQHAENIKTNAKGVEADIKNSAELAINRVKQNRK